MLKGVSFTVQPGKHIAICGRSGSGKTSLLLCLLRMIDVTEGQITLDGNTLTTRINSSDASNLAAEEVRSRFNVVPQDPFILPGTTIRFNVDPSSVAHDEDIANALQRVGLWDLVREQGGLDSNVDDLPLSAGQRQLLCFARAWVRRGNRSVLVLDEASSR